MLPSGLDPFASLPVVLVLTLAAVALGYRLTVRYGVNGDEKAESAFSLGQAAVFGLVALILGFSFSFAADRFEARRALLVNESDAIGTAYLRADYLPTPQAALFRRSMIDYTVTRLETYAAIGNRRDESQDIERGKSLQERLWQVASNAAKRDPRNLSYAALATAVNEAIDVSEQQTAAMHNHVPPAMMALVLISTLAGSIVLGITFGRGRSPNVTLAIVFCLLFASTVYAIVDLDNARGGLIHIDVAPLQAALADMKQQ